MTNLTHFVQHYRPAFLWLAMAWVALLSLIVSLIQFSPIDNLRTIVQMLCIGLIAIGTTYQYRRTWHIEPGKQIMISGQSGDLLSILLMIPASIIFNYTVVPVFQVALAAVVWPFAEIYRQTHFLLSAWKTWQVGQVFVCPDGRFLRVGSHEESQAVSKALSKT